MSRNTAISARISADSSGFSRGIASARKEADGFSNYLEGKGKSIVSSLAGVAAGYVSIGAVIESVRESAKLESITLSLASVGDKSLSASAKLEQLREMAKLPGLDFKSAAAGMIRLQAVGLTAGESSRVLKEFANSLALVGGSSEDMQGVVLALGQIMAKGKISAEEINQIAERMPTVRVAMKEAFGTADTEKLQARGMEAREFLLGMTDALEKGARAGIGLNKALSNLGDSAERVKAAFGTLAVSMGGGKVMDWLTHGLDAASTGWEIFTDAVINDTDKVKEALVSDNWGDGFAKAIMPAAKRKMATLAEAAKAERDKYQKDGIKVFHETPETVTQRQKDAAEECANYAKEEEKAAENLVKLRREIGDLSVTNEREALELARRRFTEFGGEWTLQTLQNKIGTAGDAQGEQKIMDSLREGLKLKKELADAEKSVADKAREEAKERADANKRQIESIREMVDLHDELFAKAKQLTEETKRQGQWRREYAQQDRIETLRGQGRNQAANRIERQVDFERRKRDLMEQGGLKEGDAAREARRAQRDKDGRITTKDRQAPTSAIEEFNKQRDKQFDPIKEQAERNADKKRRKSTFVVEDKGDKKKEGELGALLKAVQGIEDAIKIAMNRDGAKPVNK